MRFIKRCNVKCMFNLSYLCMCDHVKQRRWKRCSVVMGVLRSWTVCLLITTAGMLPSATRRKLTVHTSISARLCARFRENQSWWVRHCHVVWDTGLPVWNNSPTWFGKSHSECVWGEGKSGQCLKFLGFLGFSTPNRPWSIQSCLHSKAACQTHTHYMGTSITLVHLSCIWCGLKRTEKKSWNSAIIRHSGSWKLKNFVYVLNQWGKLGPMSNSESPLQSVQWLLQVHYRETDR